MVFGARLGYTIGIRRIFMNTRILLFVLSVGMVLSAASGPLMAQGVQGAKKAVATLSKKATQKAAHSPWEGVAVKTVKSSAAAEHKAAQASAKNIKAKIAAKHPKAVVWYEQRVNGKSVQQALRRAVELRGPRPATPWPKTQPQASITVSTMKGLTLDGYTGSVGRAPVPKNNIYFYRGMGLDENALRNVLKNGLRVRDTGSEANAVEFQTRLVQGGTMPLTSDLLKDMRRQQTNLTTDPQGTLHYVYLHSFTEGKVPVIVTVRNWRPKGFKGYFVTGEDIPVSDFVEVSAFVQGPNNTPLWCRVSLAEDGHSLVFAPYMPFER